jgi:hypothetical protein
MYKRNNILRFFCLIFLILLFIPLLQFSTNIIPRRSLSGFSNPDKPAFSMSGFASGEYQEKFKNWFHRKNGLWGYFLRWNNQLNYKLFSQIASGYKSALLLGKDNFLFQSTYLNSFNKLSTISDKKMKKQAKRIGKLNKLLKESGKTLILLVSPTKIEAHPEFIQSKFIVPGREARQSDYIKMKKLLIEQGVVLVDSAEVFQKSIKPGELEYFSKTGAHWNERGACVAARETLAAFSNLINSALPEILCDSFSIRENASKYERDLLAMANLADETPFRFPAYSVNAVKSVKAETIRPNIMIVGTSFMWAILSYFEELSLFPEYYFYYYFKRRVYNSPLDISGSNPNFEFWKNDLDNSTLVLLEISQARLHEAGFDFPTEAIKYLDKKNR